MLCKLYLNFLKKMSKELKLQNGRNKVTKDSICLVQSILGPLHIKLSPYRLNEPLNSKDQLFYSFSLQKN